MRKLWSIKDLSAIIFNKQKQINRIKYFNSIFQIIFNLMANVPFENASQALHKYRTQGYNYLRNLKMIELDDLVLYVIFSRDSLGTSEELKRSFDALLTIINKHKANRLAQSSRLNQRKFNGDYQSKRQDILDLLPIVGIIFAILSLVGGLFFGKQKVLDQEKCANYTDECEQNWDRITWFILIFISLGSIFAIVSLTCLLKKRNQPNEDTSLQG